MKTLICFPQCTPELAFLWQVNCKHISLINEIVVVFSSLQGFPLLPWYLLKHFSISSRLPTTAYILAPGLRFCCLLEHTIANGVVNILRNITTVKFLYLISPTLKTGLVNNVCFLLVTVPSRRMGLFYLPL